jgi:hypothetical protein
MLFVRHLVTEILNRFWIVVFTIFNFRLFLRSAISVSIRCVFKELLFIEARLRNSISLWMIFRFHIVYHSFAGRGSSRSEMRYLLICDDPVHKVVRRRWVPPTNDFVVY